MVYRVGINDIEPNHWVAWVFNLHGCFSKARTHDEALAGVPQVIKEYFRWLKGHHHPSSPQEEITDVILAEDIKSVTMNDNYIANAFFDDDKRMLTVEDIDEIRQLLVYTRKDLSGVIERITPEQLDQRIEGEVQLTIRGILNHIATAERWYFDKIGLGFERTQFPEDILQKLEFARKHTISVISKLEGMTEIFEKSGEKWSARKVLRRTLWHEIAHTRQIKKYLLRINKST
jgi:uncharacterized damage-inducible protein DinB